MRRIRERARFRKDFRRLLRGVYRDALAKDFSQIIALLASDSDLPVALRDPPLVGEYAGCRDCHIRGDLVLIYRKVDDDLLELARIGTHSDLGF